MEYTRGSNNPVLGLFQLGINRATAVGMTAWQRMSGNTPRSRLSPSPMSSTLGMDPFFVDALQRHHHLRNAPSTKWGVVSGNIDSQSMSFWSPDSLVKMPFFSLVRPYLDSDEMLTVFARMFELRTFHEGEILFHEGDEGEEDGLYIVLRGSVDVWKKQVDQKKRNPRRLGDWYTAQYKLLVDMLVDPTMQLVDVLSHTARGTAVDAIVSSIGIIFESRSKALQLMKFAISEELSKTQQVNTLFRRNSFASACMKRYSHLVGSRYLRETLTDSLLRIMRECRDVNKYELPRAHEIVRRSSRSSRSGSSRSVSRQHLANLMHVCDDLFASILASVVRAPRQLREVCHLLREEVEKKFPGTTRISVGGLMFLRFICPAIVAPVQSGCLENSGQVPSRPARRALLMVSKIMQKLANGTRFKADSEAHLVPLNDWLDSHDAQMLHVCNVWADLPVVPEAILIHEKFDWGLLKGLQWYCVPHGRVREEGPMSCDELKALYDRGFIDGMSLIWSPSGAAQWRSLASISSLPDHSSPPSVYAKANGAACKETGGGESKSGDVDSAAARAEVASGGGGAVLGARAAPAAPASSGPSLGEAANSWEACVDPKTKRMYEINRVTLESRWCEQDGDWVCLTGPANKPYYCDTSRTPALTQWHCPEGRFLAEPRAAPVAPARDRSHWIKFTTDTGNDYYVDNDGVKPTQWARPESFRVESTTTQKPVNETPEAADGSVRNIVLSSAKKKLASGIITQSEYAQIVQSQSAHDHQMMMMRGSQSRPATPSSAEAISNVANPGDTLDLGPGVKQVEEVDMIEASAGRGNTWSQHVDPATGKTFYHNKKSRLSQWDKPSSMHSIGDVYDVHRRSSGQVMHELPESFAESKMKTSADIRRFLSHSRLVSTENTPASVETGSSAGNVAEGASPDDQKTIDPDTNTGAGKDSPPTAGQRQPDGLSRGVSDEMVFEAVVQLHTFIEARHGHIRREIALAKMQEKYPMNKPTEAQSANLAVLVPEDSKASEPVSAEPEYTFAERFSMLVNRLGKPSALGQSVGKAAGPTCLATLSQGAFFGEIALFASTLRTATVTAACETQTLSLKPENLQKFLQHVPRLLDPIEDLIKQRTANSLKRLQFFSSVADEQALELLGDLFHFEQYASGDIIFSQGDPSETGLFVIVHGSLEIRSTGARGESHLLTIMEEGQPLGEVALLEDTRRTATVIAAEDVVLLNLPRSAWRSFLSSVPSMASWFSGVAKSRTENQLRTLPLFEAIQVQFDQKLVALASLFHFHTATAGETIVVQGERPDHFYILVSGQADILKRAVGKPIYIKTLLAGTYFGEMALLEGKAGRRTATVVARTPCTLLKLAAEKWDMLLTIVPEFRALFAEVREDHLREDYAREREWVMHELD